MIHWIAHTRACALRCALSFLQNIVVVFFGPRGCSPPPPRITQRFASVGPLVFWFGLSRLPQLNPIQNGELPTCEPQYLLGNRFCSITSLSCEYFSNFPSSILASLLEFPKARRLSKFSIILNVDLGNTIVKERFLAFVMWSCGDEGNKIHVRFLLLPVLCV